MIFKLFTVACNDYNFGAQWPNGRGRRFFLPTNTTFEDICLALKGKFWVNTNFWMDHFKRESRHTRDVLNLPQKFARVDKPL